MPLLWRATRSLLPCGIALVHLVFVGARLVGGVPIFCCSRLVSKFCTVEASPGALASGFNASNAAACCGSRTQTTSSSAWARLEGGDSAEAAAVGGKRSVLCPRGMVTSLHSVVSAVPTQRVMVELALIMTFPFVAAIDQRDA